MLGLLAAFSCLFLLSLLLLLQVVQKSEGLPAATVDNACHEFQKRLSRELLSRDAELFSKRLSDEFFPCVSVLSLECFMLSPRCCFIMRLVGMVGVTVVSFDDKNLAVSTFRVSR